MKLCFSSVARTLSLALLATAGIAGSAQAALVVDQGFNGNWYNPDQSGRGLMVEYIASPTTPDSGSGLPPVDLDFKRLVPATTDACVYTKAFSACPAGTTPGAQPRSCVLSGTINHDMTLTNNTTWVLSGLVKVGEDNSTRVNMSIEPGTRITGQGQTSDYLYVEPGSKLFAIGTPNAPIVFTSPNDGVPRATPAPKDWGGVVLAGNAPNNPCPTAPFDCRSEFNPALRHGGDDPHDSSGVMKYVQIRYSGYVFQPDKEVNAFTMEAVGDGTVLDHLQAYRGGDDGIEFFGGTVGLKHFIVNDAGDDGIDWDEGFHGKVQYAIVDHGNGYGEDNGIEASNQNANLDASPRAEPTLANLTFLGNGHGGDGIRFKEGTGGHVYNSVVTGFAKSCLDIINMPTYIAAGSPGNLSGVLTMNNVIINCSNNFLTDSGAPFTSADFFTSQQGNRVGSPALSGYIPNAGSPTLSGGMFVPDAFFDQTDYAGAVRDDASDWTRGWTYGLTRHYPK